MSRRNKGLREYGILNNNNNSNSNTDLQNNETSDNADTVQNSDNAVIPTTTQNIVVRTIARQPQTEDKVEQNILSDNNTVDSVVTDNAVVDNEQEPDKQETIIAEIKTIGDDSGNNTKITEATDNRQVNNNTTVVATSTANAVSATRNSSKTSASKIDNTASTKQELIFKAYCYLHSNKQMPKKSFSDKEIAKILKEYSLLRYGKIVPYEILLENIKTS